MAVIDDIFSVVGPALGGFLTGGPIGAAVGAAGGISNLAQNNQNQANIDRQNAYNSPKAQMERYREAGLNPNLVYSQGNPGNQAQPVETRAPQLDHVDTKMKLLALENQQTQNQIAKYNEVAAFHNIDRVHYDALLKETKQLGEVTRNQLLDANIPFANDLARYNAKMQAEKVNQIIGDVNLKAAHLLNAKVDNQIKQEFFKRESHWNVLRSMGIEPGDNVFLRGGVTLGQRYIPHFNQKLK